jgi:hypothetical protein
VIVVASWTGARSRGSAVTATVRRLGVKIAFGLVSPRRDRWCRQRGGVRAGVVATVSEPRRTGRIRRWAQPDTEVNRVRTRRSRS